MACASGQLLLLLGPHPYDPARYFDTAVKFPAVTADYWTLRIGLVAPVRIAVLLFGPSEAAYYAVPIAAELLLAGSVYGITLVLFRDRLLGAAAALVTALNVNYLSNADFIFPDTVGTATFTAGFFCLVLGRTDPDAGHERRLPTIAAVAAGVLFGWSYLVRELSLVLVPAVVLATILLRYPARRLALVAAAALTTAALELVYGAVGPGDPLARVHTLLERRNAVLRPHLERIESELQDPLDSVLVFPRLLLTWWIGWLFLLFVAIFVFALIRFRDRRLWLLAGWFFSYWGVMLVFSLWWLPTGELILNITNIRYWYPIFPPLVMGAFGSLALFASELVPGRRATIFTLAAATCLSAVALGPGLAQFASCAEKNVWRNDPIDRWHELRSWFASPHAQRYDAVWTDEFVRRLSPFFTHTTFGDRLWKGDVEALQGHPPSANLRRSLILVHKRFTNPDQPALRRGWSPVFESTDGWIVVLEHAQGTQRAGTERWWTRPSRGIVESGECGLNPYED